MLSSVAVAIVPHVQVECATPGEEVLGSIPAVGIRSLYWLGRSQYNVAEVIVSPLCLDVEKLLLWVQLRQFCCGCFL